MATSVTGAAFGSPHYVYLKGNDVYDSRGGNVAPSNRSYQQVAAAGDSFAALGNGIVAAWTADAYLHRVDLPVPTAAQSGVSTVVGGGDTFAALKDGQAIAWRAVDGTRIDLAAAQNRELTELFVGGVQAPQCAVYGLRNGDQVVDLCTGQTQATGAYGIARAGNSTALLVKPGAPGPVRDLAAEPGSESIALRWRAPARDGNLPIAYYILRYRVVSPSPSPWSESEVDADAEEIRTSLDALGSDPVEVQVQAVNRRFAGETTTIASATVASPQVPRNVAVTAGRNAVAVTWDAPVSFGGAVADGYEVSASAGKGCGHVHDRRCRITGLADGQFVDVSVRAKNRVYSSAAVTASGAAEPLAGASLSLTNGESPVRQFKGETVPLAASYLWRYPSGSAPPPDGSPVRLQRRVGGSTWRDVQTLGTENGVVRTTVTAKSRYWRFTVMAPGGQQLVAVRRVIALKAPKLTMSMGANSGQWGSRLSVKGRLTGVAPGGRRSAPMPGQTVDLQFRPAGKTRWSTIKGIATEAEGKVSTDARLRAAGMWRLRTPLAVSPPHKVAVTPKKVLKVDWPARISGSWRLPVHTLKNGRGLPTFVVLQYRESNFGVWEPVDYVKTDWNGDGSLLVAWSYAGYYRVCSPKINKCQSMSYA